MVIIRTFPYLFTLNIHATAQKMKFSIKDFFSKCDQKIPLLLYLLAYSEIIGCEKAKEN